MTERMDYKAAILHLEFMIRELHTELDVIRTSGLDLDASAHVVSAYLNTFEAQIKALSMGIDALKQVHTASERIKKALYSDPPTVDTKEPIYDTDHVQSAPAPQADADKYE
jgi:hypothetical protein